MPDRRGPAGDRVVLHHDLGRVVTLAWIAATVFAVALQTPAHRFGQAAWMLAVAAAGFAVGWIPALVIDDDAVTVVNPLRTSRVPWPAVDDVAMGWLLEIEAGGLRLRSLAVPGPRRMWSLWERHPTPGGVLERDGTAARGHASARGEGLIGLGDAAALVSQRRAARAAFTAPRPPVSTVSRPGVVALAAALLLAGLAVLARA